MPTLVRAASLSNFAVVAQQVGLAVLPTLRAVGLDPRVLNEPERRIPVTMVADLLEHAAERSGCPTFGLRMAESRQLGDFGAISLLIAHQPTLADALQTTIQYRHLLNDALAMEIERSEDLVILREEIVIDEPRPIRQSIELAVGTVFRMCRSLLGERWRPYSINFTHSAPPNLDAHRRVFGPGVEFNSSFNGFVCPAADLERPNPAAEPALARYARQFLDHLPHGRQSVTQDVRKAIYLRLPMGQASIAQISGGLGLNVRTLQRRLGTEGAEFADLLAGVRREMATRYLLNPRHSLTDIARALGYGHLSSFTHWFTLQFGVSPSQWRMDNTVT